jgi:hypothetical protein
LFFFCSGGLVFLLGSGGWGGRGFLSASIFIGGFTVHGLSD